MIVGRGGPGPWLVIGSELADCSLADRLRECQSKGVPGVPGPELLRHLRDCAEGLDYLHGQGVQHRDVKPPNLLLVGGGAKGGDLGLVKRLQGGQASHTGLMTCAYAAPEFFRGVTSGHSDQYSLAVSYCELRGGRLPFEGDGAAVIEGHLRGTPDLSMLPEGERAAVARALAKGPEERWPSCAAFVEQVAAAAAAGPPPRTASRVRIVVTVANRTGHRFVRAAVTAATGPYLVEPPAYINDGEDGTFCMGPSKFLEGAGGLVHRLEGHGGACEFDYAVPVLWPNRYAARCPEGFRVAQSGGGWAMHAARPVGGYGYSTCVQFIAAKAQ